MRTVVSHISALEFWRSALSDSGSARSACRMRSLPQNAPPACSMRDHPLVRDSVLSLPVHLLALDGRRNRSPDLVVHQARALPASSLRAIALPGLDEPILVTSPELTFVHMASLLGLARTVHLGYELCGTFAPDASRPYGIRSREPLTTPALLAAFLEKLGRIRGKQAAAKALPHVIARSASPRESTLAELLTLPCVYGGSKIGHPAMNAVVRVPQRSSWSTDRSFFRCDLLWREEGVAVEYDSTLCHTGAQRIAEDAARRNVLESLGLTVVTATWRQVADYREYNRFVRILAGHLGTRARPACSDYPARQFALRRELIG